MRMTLELTPSEVCTAIKHYVRAEYGKESSDVSLRIENVCSGYGLSEHMEPKFTKAVVTID